MDWRVSDRGAIHGEHSDAGDVPRVVAAAATADRPIFEAGFGVRDVASGTPIDVDFMDGMQWGLTFLINPQSLRSFGRLARLGRPGQLILLD